MRNSCCKSGKRKFRWEVCYISHYDEQFTYYTLVCGSNVQYIISKKKAMLNEKLDDKQFALWSIVAYLNPTQLDA